MRTQRISLPDLQALCVFPAEPSALVRAVSELQLEDGNAPVIVLIGGKIHEHQAGVTLQAIQTISRIAEDEHAVVICGGTDMGVMAEIGKSRWQNRFTFPLIGIVPEALATWRGGPRSTSFLWWGTKRWMLAPHFSHFLLVPGSKFGDESLWIVDTATLISKGFRSVTILINGGDVSRKDIDLSLETGRPVIALSRTGRLADELAKQSNRNRRITIIPANDERRIVEAVRSAISVNQRILLAPSLVGTR